MSKPKNIRAQTTKSREEIGFCPREDWKSAAVTQDEHALYINNHPVMQDWERGYMSELASVACSRGGRVLEVGFGMGISAGYIQTHDISEHVIIEANEPVYQNLLAFSMRAKRPVIPLYGFWQDVTRHMPSGSFSGILFDTYPLSKDEIHINHFEFFPEAYRLLVSGGVFTYYSDEVKDYSRRHRALLRRAGFRAPAKRICTVDPGAGCQYWKNDTIVIPIVTK